MMQSLLTAPSDYLPVSGNFDMTDFNTIQCIPITIISDSTTETSDECFTYTISSISSIAGLTLSPTTATICISDEEEESKIASSEVFVCFVLMGMVCALQCISTLLYHNVCSFLVSTAVTIGLQQSYYSTMEDQGPVEICIMVLSGEITGMSYIINYTTTAGLAEGRCSCIVLVNTLLCDSKQHQTQLQLTFWRRVDHL